MKISLRKELLYSRKFETKNGYGKDGKYGPSTEKFFVKPDLTLDYITKINSVEDLEKL